MRIGGLLDSTLPVQCSIRRPLVGNQRATSPLFCCMLFVGKFFIFFIFSFFISFPILMSLLNQGREILSSP